MKQEQNLKRVQIFRFTRVKLTIDPPFETVRAQSELFTIQCRQWEPIQNSQLIGKYREIPVQWQIYIYIETNAHIDTKVRWTPPFKTASEKSELFADLCCQWYPIQNGQLIRKYQCNGRYIETNAHIDTKFSLTPPSCSDQQQIWDEVPTYNPTDI